MPQKLSWRNEFLRCGRRVRRGQKHESDPIENNCGKPRVPAHLKTTTTLRTSVGQRWMDRASSTMEYTFERLGAEHEFWGDGLKNDSLLSWRIPETMNPERPRIPKDGLQLRKPPESKISFLVGCSLLNQEYSSLNYILACSLSPTHHLLIPSTYRPHRIIMVKWSEKVSPLLRPGSKRYVRGPTSLMLHVAERE